MHTTLRLTVILLLGGSLTLAWADRGFSAAGSGRGSGGGGAGSFSGGRSFGSASGGRSFSSGSAGRSFSSGSAGRSFSSGGSSSGGSKGSFGGSKASADASAGSVGGSKGSHSGSEAAIAGPSGRGSRPSSPAGDHRGTRSGSWSGDWRHHGGVGWYSGHSGYHHGDAWWRYHYGHYGFYAPIVVLPLWFSFGYSYYPGCYSYYGPGYDGYAYADYYGSGDAYASLPAPAAGEPPAGGAAAEPPALVGEEPAAPPEAEADSPEAEAGRQFHADALTAFARRDYREAARLANHAVIERPRDRKVHELLSLALFAAGEYRGAAMEAHAAAALGPVSDWPTLYRYYNDLPAYEKHLEALGEHVRKNPASLDARFLLAYHDLMLGHPKEAQELLAEIAAKVPKDKQAAELLKQAEKAAKARGEGKGK